MRTHFGGDEEGAVAIIIALCLIAIMGMTVLTVDVGGLMVTRRRLVTAADSAALAYSQWCAGGPGASATDQADSTATQNVASASRNVLSQTGSCDRVGGSGTVTTGYEATQELYFAPALGLNKTEQVSAQATAMWGAAGSGQNVVPAMLDLGSGQGGCDVPNVPAGTECDFWYDSNSLGSSQWGWLDLDHWNVATGYNCPNAGAGTRTDWILNGFPDPLPLNYPNPTYVCTTNGAAQSVWSTLENRIGDSMVYPVNDPTGQIPPCPPGTIGCSTPTKYDIVGFTSLQLTGIYRGDDSSVTGSSSTINVSCPGGATHTFPGPGSTLNLDTLCPTLAGASVPASSVLLKKGGTRYSQGVDYTYNPANHLITWLRPQTIGVQVNASGTITTTVSPTRCVGHPPTGSPANSKCVTTVWQGYSTSGLNPGGGPNLGVMAIRLSG